MSRNMFIPNKVTALFLVALGYSGTPAAGNGAPTPGQALADGTAGIDARVRYEAAEQDNALRDADAATFRVRLGYRSGTWRSVDAFGEFEGVFSLGAEDYNSGPPFLESTNHHTAHTTIADPTGEEVNRAWLRFRGVPETTVKLGRQRLILDNARFVGNVGWRQNEQTFDALGIVHDGVPNLTLTYARLRKQNFILFNDNRMNTHLFHAAYTPVSELSVRGYAYLVDFRDDAGPRAPGAPDHKVLGLRASGEIGGVRYALEYADQSDHADAPDSVDADYYLADIAGDIGPLSLRAAYEVLGGDGVHGFQTPLATNHAFQGFADVFLTTPPSGVRDRYVSLSGARAGFRGIAVYHDFRADHGGGKLGDEIDLVLARPLTPRLKALVKYADYDAADFAVDTRRFWVQAEFAF